MLCKGCGLDVESRVCPYCGTTLIENKKNTCVDTGALLADSGEDVFDNTIAGILEITTSAGSAGSGFLISRSGYALTNTHVVVDDRNKACARLSVKLNGERIVAKVILLGDNKGGNGNGIDLAIIKLDYVPASAIALTFDDSLSVRNGERVFAIGNSQGDGTCITNGIVSDKARVFYGKKYIMTDCAINPGNSGGPLLNSDGKVIGVNVMGRLSRNGVMADGMKYAIPSNEAKKFAEKYLD
ncbi:MAG: trypsin-like peptidase domain-containing protein [Clostridia bacterium]|nr:trypsin-like peptidase domain-containing protein [Clostridia bacterium]